jgi:hypothetical protein
LTPEERAELAALEAKMKRAGVTLAEEPSTPAPAAHDRPVLSEADVAQLLPNFKIDWSGGFSPSCIVSPFSFEFGRNVKKRTFGMKEKIIPVGLDDKLQIRLEQAKTLPPDESRGSGDKRPPPGPK